MIEVGLQKAEKMMDFSKILYVLSDTRSPLSAPPIGTIHVLLTVLAQLLFACVEGADSARDWRGYMTDGLLNYIHVQAEPAVGGNVEVELSKLLLTCCSRSPSNGHLSSVTSASALLLEIAKAEVMQKLSGNTSCRNLDLWRMWNAVNMPPREIKVLFRKAHKLVFLFVGDYVKSKNPPEIAARFSSNKQLRISPPVWSRRVLFGTRSRTRQMKPDLCARCSG
jgi:hypothetical protein